MVAFDRDRWPAGEADAFDHIGVKRALGQEIRAANFLGLFVEYVDEFRADKLTLRLRVGDARQARHEPFLGIDDDQRDIIMVAEQGFDLCAFVHAQQAMVDKHAGQLIANGFVNQDRGDRAVHAARKSANDAAGADLRADFGDFRRTELRHGPITR